jgi:hypothetical protein
VYNPLFQKRKRRRRCNIFRNTTVQAPRVQLGSLAPEADRKLFRNASTNATASFSSTFPTLVDDLTIDAKPSLPGMLSANSPLTAIHVLAGCISFALLLRYGGYMWSISWLLMNSCAALILLIGQLEKRMQTADNILASAAKLKAAHVHLVRCTAFLPEPLLCAQAYTRVQGQQLVFCLHLALSVSIYAQQCRASALAGPHGQLRGAEPTHWCTQRAGDLEQPISQGPKLLQCRCGHGSGQAAMS